MLVVVSHRSTSILVVDSCGWWSIGLSIDRSGINLIWILIPTLGLLLYFDWRVGELLKLDLFTLYSISFSRCGFRFKSLIRKRSYLASIPFPFQGDGPSSLYPGRANVCLLPIQSIGVVVLNLWCMYWLCWIFAVASIEESDWICDWKTCAYGHDSFLFVSIRMDWVWISHHRFESQSWMGNKLGFFNHSVLRSESRNATMVG